MFKQDRNSFYSWCPATLHYLDRYVLPVAIFEIEIQFKIWFLILYVMRSLLVMCIFRMWCWAKVVLFKFAFFHLKFGQYVHANQHITMAKLNIFSFALILLLLCCKGTRSEVTCDFNLQLYHSLVGRPW